MAELTNPSQLATDINLISQFLAASEINASNGRLSKAVQSADDTPFNPSTIVLAGSAILHTASTLFEYLQASTEASSVTTLVITGGIGHSTRHLYDAVKAHPKFNTLPQILTNTVNTVDGAETGSSNGGGGDDEVNDSRSVTDSNALEGRSEAAILYEIFKRYFSGDRVMQTWNRGRGLHVLVEEASTNCGENAIETRKILERNGFILGDGGGDTGRLDEVVIIQDATMSLRTKASFARVYADKVSCGLVRLWCWPTFVPAVMPISATDVDRNQEKVSRTLEFDSRTEGMRAVDPRGLWPMSRFFGLLLGEIPRLRDDQNGYGPCGKGFIAHVDIPTDIESAWERCGKVLEHQR